MTWESVRRMSLMSEDNEGDDLVQGIIIYEEMEMKTV
jgi:hypothetical protein